MTVEGDRTSSSAVQQSQPEPYQAPSEEAGSTAGIGVSWLHDVETGCFRVAGQYQSGPRSGAPWTADSRPPSYRVQSFELHRRVIARHKALTIRNRNTRPRHTARLRFALRIASAHT